MAEDTAKSGPLNGLNVIEMAGLGPVPLAGLMLSELGANVIRIERLATGEVFLDIPPAYNLDRLGRQIVKIDLKSERGTALVLRLIGRADVLLEGFRPGAMERLGLGPDVCMAARPELIYGRMTGFGQTGPLSLHAGHDLTYLAYSGVLHAIGSRNGKPVPPLNLVADYGGGTMFLIMGVLAALFERSRSGAGQVIDAAMIDGASMLAAPFHSFLAAGIWQDKRGSNLLDSGAPFYDTYETADGKHVAVACLEPRFFAEFVEIAGLDPQFVGKQYDVSAWDRLRGTISDTLHSKKRDEWAAIFEATDACVAPVLSLREAKDHPHNRQRSTHVLSGDFERPAPAPRFSRTPGRVSQPPPECRVDPAEILSQFGIEEYEAQALVADNIVSA